MSSKDEATRLHSLLVRARAGCCEKCGQPGGLNASGLPVLGLQCAHIVRRGYLNTRTDERNGVAFCTPDAAFFTENHQRFLTWVVPRIGHDTFTELVAKANSLEVADKPDWPTEASRLRRLLQRLTRAA